MLRAATATTSTALAVSFSRLCGGRRESSLSPRLPSPISLRGRWWIAPPGRADALDARDEVLTAVEIQLTSHGMERPFPTQQILFHGQTKDSDGDRVRQREGWPDGHTDVPASRKVADAIRHPSGSTPRGAEGE